MCIEVTEDLYEAGDNITASCLPDDWHNVNMSYYYLILQI